MHRITVDSRLEGLQSIQQPEINLALCRDDLPSQWDYPALFRKTAFVSPLVVDSPVIASLDLVRRLESLLESGNEWFFQDIRALCGLFRTLPGIDGIAAQITAGAPSSIKGTANLFHADINPGVPDDEFIRLTRVYRGGGAEWTPNENVCRQALRESVDYAERHFVRALDYLDPTHIELSNKILKDPDKVHTVPPGWISLFKGGVGNGLVHRASSDDRHRVVLIITAFAD
jgi:hypothetical protein